jgi:hypothetical protein
MTAVLLIPGWVVMALVIGAFLGALVRHGDRAATVRPTDAGREPNRPPAAELPRIGATT